MKTTNALAGFNARYFRLPEGTTELSQVDFSTEPEATDVVASLQVGWTGAPLWDGGPRDHFAAQYTGQLTVETAGTYTFFLRTDGAQLYIDDRLVADSGTLDTATQIKVTLDLADGPHRIDLRYADITGGQSLRFDWKGPDTGGARVAVAAPAVTADAATMHEPGLFAEYFVLDKATDYSVDAAIAAAPVATGVAASLAYLRTNDPFWDGGQANHFAARYTGDLNVGIAGSYTLFAQIDNGARIYLDGQLVLESETPNRVQEVEVTLDLTAGSHDLQIVYYDLAGKQSLTLEWSGPDTGGQKVLIDGAALSHEVAANDGGMDGGTDGGMDGGMDGGTDSGTDGGMDGGMDMGHDDGTDMGHGDAAAGIPEPPPPGSDPATVDAWVATVIAAPETMAHGDDQAKMDEHMAVLDLVPRDQATHVAVADGDWFDPATWHNGVIPDAGAKVLIPETVSVRYDGQSDASLFTVRVDGELSFATDVDTRMLLDTMVVSTTGRLEIGTADNPVQSGVSAEIVIANNGDIDTGWDPMLLSRGIVSHGDTVIHGAEKTAFLKVAEAPMAGDTTIELSDLPDGWQVGDTIVLSGTHKQGWSTVNGKTTFVESEDEEVTITAIDGTTLTIDRPLAHDHDTPRDDLFAYVANNSRTITFSSEDGPDTAIHHRGHVMFMHAGEVDVRYAAFDDLGRTDKSQDAFDIGALDSVSADSNIKSRYPFHFHRLGVDDPENPAMAVGNAVSGSPGWGFVHHDSNAEFIDNVAFDIFGAAFAAEDGNETGIWLRNIAIKSQGIGYSPSLAKDGDDVARDDNGRTGDGFFFAGRLVEAAGNVAVNTTNGFVWMTRGPREDPAASSIDQPEIAYGAGTVTVDTPPIQGFLDNEAFGTYRGLMVIKANPNQGHDVRTVLDGFLNWETSTGLDLSYTAHYTLKDFDLLATRETGGLAAPGTAVILGKNALDVVLNGFTIDGFKTGIDHSQGYTFDIDPEDAAMVLIDVVLRNVATEYVGLDPSVDSFLLSSQLKDVDLSFDMQGDLTITGWSDTLDLVGTKTDSLGTYDRTFGEDVHQVSGSENLIPLVQTEGYWTTADGRKIVLVDDYVADRATGEIHKLCYVVTLDIPDHELEQKGAVYNGVIDLDGAAPVVGNDSAIVQSLGAGIILDVLANDRDPDGAPLRIDGLTDARHGEVFLQEDGTILYRPYMGHEGTDSFDYWATDGTGQFTKGVVTIDVWA